MNQTTTITRAATAALGGLLLATPVGCGAASRGTTRASVVSDQTPSIAIVINQWHEAAGRADFDAYFGRMSDDAVFLGTDATERWTRPEFEAFARPYFDDGRGWLYEPIDRKIMIAPGGRTAWFDERLANAGLGECRGTGVTERGGDGTWRIAHYSLTIPIPNAIARDIAGQIKSLSAPTPPPADDERAEADTP